MTLERHLKYLSIESVLVCIKICSAILERNQKTLNKKSYRSVITLFAITALMSMATSYAFSGKSFTSRALSGFISFSMAVCAFRITGH